MHQPFAVEDITQEDIRGGLSVDWCMAGDRPARLIMGRISDPDGWDEHDFALARMNAEVKLTPEHWAALSSLDHDDFGDE